VRAAAATLVVSAALAAAATVAPGADARADACRWRVALQLTSVLGGERGDVYDVSGASPNDVWVGGWDGKRVSTDAVRATPLLAHWNGRRWRRTPVPVRWGIAAPVVAVSPTDAWAVVDNRDGTLLLHWNGRRWSRTSLPRGSSAYQTSLALGPGGRLWLIGRRVYVRAGSAWRLQKQFGDNPANARFVVSRWTDSIWRVIPSPQPGARAPRVERWNGRRWVPTPTGASRFTELGTPLAFSPRDAWLGGTDGDNAFLFHWNGRTWRRVGGGPPTRSVTAEALAPARGDLWLAGSLATPARTASPPYLRHRLGSRWTTIAPPTQEDADDVTLYGVGRETWARTDLRDDVYRLVC
jgi:hypothetical protein